MLCCLRELSKNLSINKDSAGKTNPYLIYTHMDIKSTIVKVEHIKRELKAF